MEMRLGRRYKLQLDLKTMAVTLVVVLLLAPLPSSVMPQWPNKKLEAAGAHAGKQDKVKAHAAACKQH